METEKTGYERALELIEECKQTRSTTLDLGNLGLTEIPDELWGCAWLKELNFGDTFHFIEDMGWIKSKNSLSSNKLDIIPKNIKSLNKLQILSFNNNKISKIENLDELSNLKKIYFIKNKIRKIEISYYTLIRIDWAELEKFLGKGFNFLSKNRINSKSE